jgi:hypothetical protein
LKKKIVVGHRKNLFGLELEIQISGAGYQILNKLLTSFSESNSNKKLLAISKNKI